MAEKFMEIDVMTMEVRKYYPDEVPAILQLLRKCFPEAWGAILDAGRKELSYLSESTIGLMDGRLVGNCGMLKIPVELDGQTVVVAGIGSVAVDPDYRGQGIAVQMLRGVLARMSDEHIFLSPLFTDKPGVYESLGWTVQPLHPTHMVSGTVADKDDGVATIVGEPSPELFAAVKSLYRQSFRFNGKVIRTDEYWQQRVLDNMGGKAKWLLHIAGGTVDAYGLMASDGAGRFFLCEAYSRADTPDRYAAILAAALKAGQGRLTVALPATHPFFTLIADRRLTVSPGNDVYGEVLMLNNRTPQSYAVSSFYWPYADKF